MSSPVPFGAFVFPRFVIIYTSLEYKRSRIPFLPVLLCLAGAALADEQADSLAFTAKRKQILENAPDERRTLILGAAEELAREGYYADALDLIFSLEADSGTDWEEILSDATDPGKAPLSPSLSPPRFYGYVQSTFDYDDWEGQDSPYGGRLRAKLEWDPEGRVFDRVAGVFQGSDRNAYFDFSAKGTAFDRMLKLESEVLAEKRLRQTYGDSLDRAFLRTRMEANTRPLGGPLALVAPVYAEAQKYRFDRLGSNSYLAYGTMPGLEAVSEDLRKSLILSWEVRRTDYPKDRGAGNFRNGPVALAEWYGNRITIDGDARFQTSDYFRDSSRYRLREWETRGGIFFRTWPWLRAGVRTSGATEIGDYRDSLDLTNFSRLEAAYQLKGSVWSVQPQLIAEWARTYALSVYLTFTRGSYPILFHLEGNALQLPKYLEESFDDWKPGASVTILSKAIFLTLSAHYQENWVAYSPEYTLGSSRGMDANCHLYWKFLPWMELDFSGLASRRLDKGSAPGRIQNMTSVSLGLTSRFP